MLGLISFETFETFKSFYDPSAGKIHPLEGVTRKEQSGRAGPYPARRQPHPEPAPLAVQTRTFSPKELAVVLGVSESSIKRWGDAGLIDVTRTAGGHRRIVMHEALRFIRRQDMRILRPDLLGLPDLENLPPEARAGDLTADALFELLRAGRAAQARGLVAAAYLDGTPLAHLFDGPVAGALERFGERWTHEEGGIFHEHVATNVCIEAVGQVRLLIPPPEEGAPVALGGAPEGDPYLLPTLMAAAVLADAGLDAVNLGAHTPVSALQHAVAAHAPRLVWLACTAPLSERAHEALVQDLVVPLGAQSIEVVVGGRGAEAHQDAWPASVRVLGSMAALAALATELTAAAP